MLLCSLAESTRESGRLTGHAGSASFGILPMYALHNTNAGLFKPSSAAFREISVVMRRW